ncbi:MAG: hypothetical protein ACRCUE_08185 [Bosea sp. (in: a-proteobacteria)]
MTFVIAHITDTQLSQAKPLILDNHGDVRAINARMNAQQEAAE